jgi:hypothetical protein
MSKVKTSYLLGAIGTIVVGVGYLLIVITSEDLRTNPFVQGITGAIVAALITIALFTLTKSEAIIRLPVKHAGLASGIISVTGAAAFYLLLLPTFKDIIFPYYTLSGYVAYEDNNQSEDEFSPVEGANVEIKDTGLRTKTAASGEFVFARVPSQANAKEIIVNYAGRSKIFEVKKNKRGIYRIRKEQIPTESAKTQIKTEEWKEQVGGKCSSGDRNKFLALKQFSLDKNIPKLDGRLEMFIDVLLIQEGVQVVSANLSKPQDHVEEVQPSSGYERERKWALEIQDDTLVHVDVCLGSSKKGTNLTSSGMSAFYWFQ